MAGVEREFDTEIVEQHPDERIAWKSTDSVDHAGVVTFERLDNDETKVRVQLEWGPDTAMEKLGSAAGADDREVKSDLKRFKEFMQKRGAETGGWRGDVEEPGTGSTLG